MDLNFSEVDAPPPRRTWMWLGIACIATFLLVLFLLSPSAAAIAGLVVLAAMPLAFIAGTRRTTAPLAVVGALALAALGTSAVTLVADARPPGTVVTPAPQTAPSATPPGAVVRSSPSLGALRPLPTPADIKAAPPSPDPTPSATDAPAPAELAGPVQAAPAEAPPPAVAPAPAPAAAPAPQTQAAAPQTQASSGPWGQLPVDARTQVCAAAAQAGLKVPPGQCR